MTAPAVAMVDTAPKKTGFLSLFGGRSSKEPASRKKLSKKGALSEGVGLGKLDSTNAANPGRQDSASFATHSANPPREDAGLPTYEDATGLEPRTYRDYPFAAPSGVPTYLQSESLYDAEYRRNSEGQQQFAIPLYNAQRSRAESLPLLNNAQPTRQAPQAPTRAPPNKLTKSHRQPVRQDDLLDKDTGERKDLTDMMHAFTYNDAPDTMDEMRSHRVSIDYDPSKPDGTAMLGSVSPEVWLHVADYLSPLDVARLSSTCRTMFTRLGRQPYKLLADPTNRSDRLDFLLALDQKLPRHLFCFPCAQWHLRIQPGLETIKPHNVLNPLFDCPNRTNNLLPPPRLRITDGRTLNFTFVQLARRHWEFGPEYGVSAQSLSRRWKEPSSSWSHDTMYHITDKGHVLMRVKSQVFVEGGMTAAAKRMLLFSRGDYTPYFSVCSHWKDGMLTSVPKCSLDHIPVYEYSALGGIRDRLTQQTKSTGLIQLCHKCRPMRRCPECPTEYLSELKMVEDKSVKMNDPQRFRQALVVTRWSDLGPGRSPADREWAAIMGDDKTYDSFHEIGRRAVSGVFESAFTDTIPGQRIVSMNPNKVKANDIGGEWY
jgi:hypothetical protein